MELHLQPKSPKETEMTKHPEPSTSFKKLARAPMPNTIGANVSIQSPVEIETEVGIWKQREMKHVANFVYLIYCSLTGRTTGNKKSILLKRQRTRNTSKSQSWIL